MTADELRAARQTLDLSTAGLATVLRLGAHGARTVRRWESGASRVPGPVQVAIEMMLGDVRREAKKEQFKNKLAL